MPCQYNPLLRKNQGLLLSHAYQSSSMSYFVLLLYMMAMGLLGKFLCRPPVHYSEVRRCQLLETADLCVRNMKELFRLLDTYCRLLLLFTEIIRPMTALKLDMICDRVAGACFAKTG